MLIKLNYDLAVAQANKIKKAGQSCSDIATAIGNQIAAIQACWTGEAADAMVEQLTAWQKEVSEMNTTLSALATNIASKAGELKAIDEAEGGGEGAFGSGDGGGGFR